MLVSMVIVRALLTELSALGIAPADVLNEAKLAPLRLSEPADAISSRDFARLVSAAAHLSDDPSLGLRVGQNTPLHALHALGPLLMTSATLRGAVNQANRYLPALASDLTFVVRENGDEAAIGFRLPEAPPEAARFCAEYVCAQALSVVRSLTDKCGGSLLEVQFVHAAPAERRRHLELFKCPVSFSASENALVFPRAALDAKQPYADSDLHQSLSHMAEETLLRAALRDDLQERVRRALRFERDLAHVDFDRVAQRWGMTHRTLRRKLRTEGVLLSDLLDEARLREASRELARPEESIKSVAERLGYAETSSFHRAFKRWAGVTPAEYRKRAGIQDSLDQLQVAE